MIYAVIAAGGTGSRAEKELPKQYIEIGGKPVIIHTLEKFTAEKRFNRIILLCPCEWLTYTKELVDSCFGRGVITVIEGGQTRNATVMKAVDYIENNDGLYDDTVIVTHDAVRPFVTQSIISEHIKKIPFCEAIGTVIPATDTVILSNDGNNIDSTPKRSKVYQCQTPQSFKAKKLKELYNGLTDSQKSSLTDTCSVFTFSGEKVELVAGDTANFKITYPHDIKIAEALLK